jgi:riboflavin kinase / FMN adenylyltransferase
MSGGPALVEALAIAGTVEHGDHRGRTLGFPTANVRMGAEHAAIADGVYAATVRLDDGVVCLAAVSIGRRPTFYAEGTRLCEAHLLDFDGDLYDRPVEVELRWFVRRQVRFDGLDALVAQLQADVADCRRLLRDDQDLPD